MSTPRRARCAFAFESFEARRLMAAVVVTTLNDSGAGSLRAALAIANVGDTVDASNLSGTITLASPLSITKNVTIAGPGPAELTISGNNNTVQGIRITGGLTVSINDLTIDHAGTSTDTNQYGGAIAVIGSGPVTDLSLDTVVLSNNAAGRVAGAIYADRTNLTITDCSFLNNTAAGGSMATGGAVASFFGSVNASGCTFAGNTATAVGSGSFMGNADAYGGALYLVNSVNPSSIANCTFATNTASAAPTNGDSGNAQGGGVYIATNDKTVDFQHVTLANNAATPAGDVTSTGGGLYAYSGNPGLISVGNSIVSGNTATTAPELAGNNPIAATYSLIGDGTGSGLTNGTENNFVGTTASPIDAKLGGLTNNGGKTKTLALLSGSPAVDAGTPGSTTADQRGVSRDLSPDLGAFEVYTPPPLPPTTISTPGVVLDNGVVKVVGTGSDDLICVFAPRGRMDVLRAHMNGRNWNFSLSAIVGVDVDAGAGNDVVTANLPELGSSVYGNDGNDTIVGGVADDSLSGGSGDDQLSGMGGNDRLYGNAGRDKLMGYDGRDSLYGGGGNDKLIGGPGLDLHVGDAGRDTYLTRDFALDTITGGNDDDQAYADDGDVVTGVATFF